MNNITTFLFDLGSVLMHIDFEAFPRALGLTASDLRHPYEGEMKKIVLQYECGEINTKEFQQEMVRVFQDRYSPDTLLNAFDAIILEDNRDIIPLVHRVKNKFDVAILSNTCLSHWQKVLRVSSLVPIFPHAFTSFHLGVMKPDRRAYEKVCTSLNVNPESVLFIDDLRENVEGAKAIGMNGIIYTDVDALGNTLKEYL